MLGTIYQELASTKIALTRVQAWGYRYISKEYEHKNSKTETIKNTGKAFH